MTTPFEVILKSEASVPDIEKVNASPSGSDAVTVKADV